MILQALGAALLASIIAFGGDASARTADLGTAAEGLVPVPSRNLDAVYLRPEADFSAYRKVMIEPVRVTFHKDWLKYPYPGELTRPVGEDRVRRIAHEVARDTHASIVEAFRARGYEVVTAPGRDVLRLSPAVTDLYVNAPDRFSAWRTIVYTREAGQAVLLLDAFDSLNGTLLGRVSHLGIAEQMNRLMRADAVSNRFWFEALLRRWATSCAGEIAPH